MQHQQPRLTIVGQWEQALAQEIFQTQIRHNLTIDVPENHNWDMGVWPRQCVFWKGYLNKELYGQVSTQGTTAMVHIVSLYAWTGKVAMYVI